MSSDDNVGLPVQRPAWHVPVDSLGEADRDELELDERGEVQAEFSVASQILSSRILFACILLFVTAFSIVVLSEVVQFIGAVQNSPAAVQIVAYTCIVALAATFFWAIGRLLVAYRQLAASPQVRLDRNRALTREQIASELDAGYNSLYAIVKQYPIKERRQRALLRRAGMGEDKLETLRCNIDTLLIDDNLGKVEWIGDCDRLFVKLVDECAKRRVRTYARRVALKTALSPTGLIDSLIVAINAVFMVEDLCRIYSVKTSRWHAVLLAGRVVVNTIISARLEDSVDDVTNTLFKDAISSIPGMTKEAVAKVSLGITKRMTEGAINAKLVYRLGASTIAMLRPIKMK